MIEIDAKIKNAIDNCVNLYKRCTFILIGSQATKNVPILFSIRNFDVNCNTKILWCFKRDNAFIKRGNKNNRKFEKSCKKMNLSDENFDNFIFGNEITWCHYNDSDGVLGSTFDACVLQDFDALTPNKIAKVIETVRGGGLIMFLLPGVNQLSDLGAMEMDAHKKYKTPAFDHVNFRFNYRFFYSILNHQDCFLLDNNLQILPINLKKIIENHSVSEINHDKRTKKLKKLKKKLIVGREKLENLIEMCATSDQSRALSDLFDCINSSKQSKSILQPPNKKQKLDKNNNNSNHKSCLNSSSQIAMVTSGRGRGKSALLGLTIAAGIDSSELTRVCVTSPTLQNVTTLMQFVMNGLSKLGYRENIDFIKRSRAVENSNNHSIVEIEIVKNGRRQIVQYVAPIEIIGTDRIDWLCIDETAAIPLPIVRQLMTIKCDIVFMASTIHGYEGTGRSLSLKLMKQTRERFSSGADNDQSGKFLEINLKEPIRYSSEDNVEKWLNNVLCLDCENDFNENSQTIENYQPSLNDCQLFFVNRNVLFSGSFTSELFLQQIMGIYVSSHYKNTPNDLQMLSDCASHALFCLAKPALLDNGLPIVCVVIQIAFEGSIDPLVAKSNLETGNRPSGDMIPWTIVQQFNQYEFAKLSGARIVRIAVHHKLQRQGYGGHALKLLHDHFNQNRMTITGKNEHKTIDELVKENEELNDLSKLNKLPSVQTMGPLLVKLTDINLVSLDYIGVSFGLTSELLRFWKRNNFLPVYLRQTVNDTTGEHSCIMIQQFSKSDSVDGQSEWLKVYHNDFCRRFCNLLPGPFRKINSIMALELLCHKTKQEVDLKSEVTKMDINIFFTKSDLIRLDKYLKNVIDYHGIIDLVHCLALLFHTKKFTGLKIPKFQNLVLVGLGLQYKSVDELALDLTEAGLNSSGTSGSEILGHMKECLKSMSKNIKVLMK